MSNKRIQPVLTMNMDNKGAVQVTSADSRTGNGMKSGAADMRRSRVISVMFMTVALVIAMSASVLAESNSYDGTCVFNGSRMVSSFTAEEVASAVENLQPGDDVTFTVEYSSEDDEDTDWYMENTVTKTLESIAKNSKKRPAGIGSPEAGGYTYELILHDSKGKTSVLFSSDEVGGENGKVTIDGKSEEGLEPATNALDDWFFIDTVKSGASGEVVLHVAFDGETEVNDYMDTDGELNLRFAVEKVTGSDNPPRTVKTGDQSRLILWAVIAFIAGLLLFILAFISSRRDRREASETGSDASVSGGSGNAGTGSGRTGRAARNAGKHSKGGRA